MEGTALNKKIYLSMCNKTNCSGPVHVVEPGDTLYGIAQKHHTRVRVLLDLNPFVDIYNLQPGDEICIPASPSSGQMGFRPYVVKQKETVSDILKTLSMSFEELARVNKVLSNLTLRPGTILLVPADKIKA
ncbi:hypothetical protein B5E53_05250 [Eubacterium sp. An11]|nr:hypothetical protein B5E53_05250 [Eubacterium sp. An11]